jgi:hypothetical protein
MALDTTVKVGPEFYVYASDVGNIYVDPTTRAVTEVAAPTVAPTVEAAAGTSGLAAAAHYVKYTWYDGVRETTPSPAGTVTPEAGQNINVTLPAFPVASWTARIYIGTVADSETLQGEATTTSYVQDSALEAGAALPADNTLTPNWELISYSRFPISSSEPEVVVDVYDHFAIDHTKKGKQQRKTLSIRKAYTNMTESFRQFIGKRFLIKVECHPDDGVVNEAIYYRDVRILTPSLEIPEEEATESVECVYAESGSKDLSA